MMLETKTPQTDNLTHSPAHNISTLRPREKRTIKKGASTVSLMKPILASFLNVGKARLASMAAARFVSSALPISSLLILGANILALVISIVTEFHNPTATSPYTTINPNDEPDMGSWELQSSPPLHTLTNSNPACSDIGLLTTLSVPATLRSLAEILNDLARPLHRIARDPQPISDTLKLELMSSHGFGFWSDFDPNKKHMSRFFVARIQGSKSTATRQIAALSGNAESSLKEGTILAGSKNVAGHTAPQWSCLEFALEMAENSKKLPKTCYGPPSLHHKFFTKVPFLPDSEILKVTGKHIIQSTCPNTGTETRTSRGLLVTLIPNTCDLLIDGSRVKAADHAAQPPWTKALTLLDRTDPLEPLEHSSLPKSFRNAIQKISDNITQPHLSDLANIIDQEGYARHTADISSAITLSGIAVILMTLYAIRCLMHRCENTSNTEMTYESYELKTNHSTTPPQDPGSPPPRSSANQKPQGRNQPNLAFSTNT